MRRVNIVSRKRGGERGVKSQGKFSKDLKSVLAACGTMEMYRKREKSKAPFPHEDGNDFLITRRDA